MTSGTKKVSKLAAEKQSNPILSEEALVEQYLPFSTSIASKVAKTLPSEIDFDEVLCNARLGLLEAAQRFDQTLSIDFKTFAYYRIRGAIFDGLRKTGWLPRSLYAKLKREQEAQDQAFSTSGHIVDGAKDVDYDLTAKFLETAASTGASSSTAIYMTSLDNMEDFEVEDLAATDQIEYKAEFQKVKEKMREAIESLPDKERKLVKMYYFQNKTLQEVGDKLGLSKSWTSRLHARALEILFKKLTAIGEALKEEGEFYLN